MPYPAIASAPPRHGSAVQYAYAVGTSANSLTQTAHLMRRAAGDLFANGGFRHQPLWNLKWQLN